MRKLLLALMIVFMMGSVSAVWSISLNEDLVAYYKLDGLSGPVIDCVGGHDGIAYGGVTMGYPGIQNGNNSFHFNGQSNGYVIVLNINDTIPFTVNGWINTQSTQLKRVFSSVQGNDMGFSISATESFSASVSNRPGTTINSIQDIADGQWHMVTLMFNGTSGRLYVDGQLHGENNNWHTLMNSQNPIWLGKMVGEESTLFFGEMDEFAVWERTLIDEEVIFLWNNGNGVTYDGDTDGDGILDPEDNCPFDYNPDQNDSDEDGIGDVCDDNPNAPTWDTVVQDRTVFEGTQINITLSATDIDEDTLTYFIIPEGFFIQEDVNLFSWLTTETDSGFYNFLAQVFDGEPLVETSFLVTVMENTDLVIDNLIFSNLMPIRDEEVTITAMFSNILEVNPAEILVSFYDGDPDEEGAIEIGNDTVINTRSDTYFAQIDWTATAGDHEIYVVLDSDEQIIEGDETNNEMYKNLTVAVLPDLVVLELSFTNPSPSHGELIDIIAMISNIEEISPPSPFDVEFYVDDSFVEKRTLSLDGENTETLVVEWLAEQGSHTVRIEVDSMNKIDEQDEINNQAIVQIEVSEAEGEPTCPYTCGDIDGDGGNVDLADFTRFAGCFNKGTSSSWNCLCSDLDGDGNIGLTDFRILANLYGKQSENYILDC